MSDQLTALAAWVGALAALGTLGTTLSLLRRQAARERAEAIEAIKAQAAQVAAWIESKEGKDTGELLVKNASSQPVYDVLVELSWRVDERIPIVPPATTVKRPVDFLKKKTAVAVAELVFTDDSGRRWKRDQKGNLREELKAR